MELRDAPSWTTTGTTSGTSIEPDQSIVGAGSDTTSGAGDASRPPSEPAPSARTAPSYRPGHRRGCPEEILVTIAGSPDDTLRDVVHHAVPGTRPDGTRIVQGVRRLQVDPTTLWVEHNVERSGDRDIEHDVLMWAATLRTNPFRRRRATLRMFASPSTNVTVLTLTPVRPRRFATRAFVRSGWRAMTELRDRIDHRHAGEVRHGPPRQRSWSGAGGAPG